MSRRSLFWRDSTSSSSGSVVDCVASCEVRVEVSVMGVASAVLLLVWGSSRRLVVHFDATVVMGDVCRDRDESLSSLGGATGVRRVLFEWGRGGTGGVSSGVVCAVGYSVV